MSQAEQPVFDGIFYTSIRCNGHSHRPSILLAASLFSFRSIVVGYRLRAKGVAGLQAQCLAVRSFPQQGQTRII